MADSKLEKLFFIVSLIDRVSAPAKGVGKALMEVQRTAKDGFMTIGKGALSIGTAAASLSAFTGPARDFEKALGEVASLDTPAAELDKLAAASKSFARQFGGDAAAIARSAYDIQSAIPGLTEGALAAFTVQGNLLAKATKADAATITAFQGTMYNIFEEEANRIGQAKWVEQLAGKTAQAVKIFKTTGNDMSAAFTNVGSTAQKAGVSLDEQLAVLGTLQGTMGGANAGTAYKAFLNAVGRAQLTTRKGETLKFTDESGKLLPMVKILEKIRAAVGPGQLKLADQTKLMQAFGDEGGKAVLNLLDKTENLKSSIGDLQKIQDSSGAVKMAQAMTDPLDRFRASVNVLKITLGRSLLPVINAVLNAITAGLAPVNWLLDNIPPLRWLFAAIAFAIAGASMTLGIFWVAVGGGKVLSAFISKMKLLRVLFWQNARAANFGTIAQKLWTAAYQISNLMIGRGIIRQKLAVAWQWLYTTSLKSGVFWQKMGAVWSTTLAICTGRQTTQTALATAATGGLSLAQLGLIVKEKALVLWTGLTKIATVGLNIAMAALKLVMLAGVVPAAMAAGAGILAMKIPMLLMSAASWIASGGLAAAATSVWAFTAALFACPVTWIVVGIAALIAGLVGLVYYWDQVCAFCSKYADYLLALLGPVGWIVIAFRNWDKITAVLRDVWGWFKKVCPNIAGLIEKLVAIAVGNVKFAIGFWKDILTGAYDWIVMKFSALGNFFAGLWDSITAAGAGFYDWLAGKLLPLVQFFSDAFAGAGNVAAAIWGGIQNALGSIDGWIGKILRGLSKIPGLGILSPDVDANGNPVAPPVSPAAAAAMTARSADPVVSSSSAGSYDVPAGGVRNSTVNNNRNYNVEVYAPNGLSPAQLEEYLILQGA